MSLTERLEDRPVRAFSLRRTALLMGVALAVTPAVVRASADTTATNVDTPRLGCTHAINDAPGDAKPDYTGAGATPGTSSNDALDLEMVDARLTDSLLEVFLAIKQIPAPGSMAPTESTYRYTVSFSYGGKTFLYGAEQQNPQWANAYPSDSSKYPMMTETSTPTDLKASSTWAIREGATGPSWVVFTTSRDKIEQVLGGSKIPDGAVLTDFSVSTQAYTSPAGVHSTNDGLDSSLTAQQKSLVVGGDLGDWCFGAPPTSIGSVTVAPADVTDSSTMSAILLDENGKALAGKPLTFAVKDGTGKTVTGTTDANGKATVSYGPIKAHAGTYPVTVSFPGDTTLLKASTATGTLTVSAEATAFKALKVAKPSAKTRVVTATLVDDSGHPIAGVPITWYVNGKKVASAKTAGNGTAVLKSAKPGQTVQAKFAGVSGMFLASNSKAAKV